MCIQIGHRIFGTWRASAIPWLLGDLRLIGWIAFWQDGRLDEAAQMLSAAAVAPNNPAILAELGCLLRLQGKTAEAMQCFLDLLALNPRQVQVWLNAASLNNETCDKSAAEKALSPGARARYGMRGSSGGAGSPLCRAAPIQGGSASPRCCRRAGLATAPIYACLA